MGFPFRIMQNDALAKARGEPTRGFHNVKPNYSNPEIMAAVADKKAGRSTTFYSTGIPTNRWQQYADSNRKKPASKKTASGVGLLDPLSTAGSNNKLLGG